MLDNEFDKYFRDRLLDHPSKVRVSMWKRVQTHLLRHKGFNFWKWYIAGPSAVAAVVSGYVILTNFLPSGHNRKPATAVATYNTPHTTDSATATLTPDHPGTTATTNSTDNVTTDSTANAVTNPATNPTTAKGATASTKTSASQAATSAGTRATSATGAGSIATTNPTAAANPKVAANPSPATTSPTGAGSIAATSPTAAAGMHARPTNHPPGLASTHRHRRPSSTERSGVAGSTTAGSTTSGTGTAEADLTTTAANTPSANRTTTGPPIPAQLAAPAKLVTLATPPALKVKTPNVKNTGAGAVAVTPAKHKDNTKDKKHDRDRFRIDVYGAPEFFAWHPIGISWAAGVRLTAVFKKHFTLTSGVQYMRTNITHPNTLDSSNGVYPGYFKNIHIPVLLGYTISNDRFTYSVYGGVLFSAYAQSKFTNPAATVTANPNGISGYLGFDFSQHWANHFSYYAEPYLKCYFPPGDIDLPPQLWSVGVQLGLRCSF